MSPLDVSMSTPLVGLAGALVAAVAYGVWFLPRPPSTVRTVVKTLSVLILAVASGILSWGLGLPWGLTLGLALSAVGDAFLAGDPKRWLPFGLGSFLAAHLCYVVTFAMRGDIQPDPWRWAVVVTTLVVGVLVLRWLWGALGALRWAVVAYGAAIMGMVFTALMLPGALWQVMVGAVLFFASDALLSAQLFRNRLNGRKGQVAVWSLYWLGQAAIFYAFGNEALGRIVI